MPLPTITDCTRCAIRLTASGTVDEVINVIHVDNGGTGTPADIDAVLGDAWAALIRDFIPTIFTWQDITYTPLDGSSSTVIPWSSSQPDGGATAAPMQAAACVSWRTALSGRSNRGRSYLGPFTASMADATHPDKLSSTPFTSLVTLSSDFIAAMAAGGFPLQVASYKLSSARHVTHSVVNPKVCSQRKRVNGR